MGDAAELGRVEVVGHVLVGVDRDVGPVVEVDHRHAERLEDLVVAAELERALVGDQGVAATGGGHEPVALAALGELRRHARDIGHLRGRDLVTTCGNDAAGDR